MFTEFQLQVLFLPLTYCESAKIFVNLFLKPSHVKCNGECANRNNIKITLPHPFKKWKDGR